jgi:uncharacterized iron-regulated protein
VICASVLSLILAASALPAGAGEIGPSDLAALPPTDVVILGEIHDNPAHHANQAAAVAALQPKALVFEMLTPEQAARITPANRGDAAALGEALGWEASGWPDFAMYYPIFAAAPEAQVFGAAFPRTAVNRAVAEGAAAVFGPDAVRYGLDRPLPPGEQAERESEQAEAHCDALPEELLPGMVAAQRLRDAGLARAVVEAIAATGGPVAVITGDGHARMDRGLAVYLSRAEPRLSVLSVGQLEAPPDESEGERSFDLWLVSEPAEREDPCAVFR